MATHEANVAKRTVLSVTGMTCSGCANAVTGILSRVPGVSGVEVDLAAARAVVDGSPRLEDLVVAAEGAGFGAQLADARTSKA